MSVFINTYLIPLRRVKIITIFAKKYLVLFAEIKNAQVTVPPFFFLLNPCLLNEALQESVKQVGVCTIFGGENEMS